MKPFLPVIVFFLLIISCSPSQHPLPAEQIAIIPQPVSITTDSTQFFTFDNTLGIVYNDSSLAFMATYLKDQAGLIGSVDFSEKPEKPSILLELSGNGNFDEEEYSLTVSQNQIHLQAGSLKGMFPAIQSLLQILPKIQEEESALIQKLSIKDNPRFKWRGVHLDVSRHFMPADFIKKFIDYLAMHKMNVFHWHLVDGIGWRIEINSHPELTETGAWRKVKEGKMPWQDFEVWREGDQDPKYGGYYTQDEIREIVNYAAERQITIIPEIELPGHSEVVMQCFPELVCKDDSGTALKNRGVYCASNPDSYTLLEDILNEVIDLFPSEYIHIGGDEVGKYNWEHCSNCTKFMKKNSFDSHQLQSHFVNHFDAYLQKKGRKLIGWHEILEGNLSPDATIMYWGGADGTEKILEKGHPIVLSPGSHLYFDHYQSLSTREPQAFGGYSPLRKVYEYDPIPEHTSIEKEQLVLGVQANLWTEYMPDEKQVEYMLFPRIAALSELAWTARNQKNWSVFSQKMDKQLTRYYSKGINVAPSAFRPQFQIQLNPETQTAAIVIETELNSIVHFTTDGAVPDSSSIVFEDTLQLKKSTELRAVAYKEGKVVGPEESTYIDMHKGLFGEIISCTKGTGRYNTGGQVLIDANFGGDKWGNGRWLGVLNQDLELILKLKQEETVESVVLSCLESTGPGIYFPKSVDVWVSKDGQEYKYVGMHYFERDFPIPKTPEVYTRNFEVSFNSEAVRYIKVKARWQQIPDTGSFIFADEIMVR